MRDAWPRLLSRATAAERASLYRTLHDLAPFLSTLRVCNVFVTVAVKL